MQTTSKHSKKVKQPGLLLKKEPLEDRLTQVPLFPEKIKKATQIMSMVRQKQANR